MISDMDQAATWPRGRVPHLSWSEALLQQLRGPERRFSYSLDSSLERMVVKPLEWLAAVSSTWSSNSGDSQAETITANTHRLLCAMLNALDIVTRFTLTMTLFQMRKLRHRQVKLPPNHAGDKDGHPDR